MLSCVKWGSWGPGPQAVGFQYITVHPGFRCTVGVVAINCNNTFIYVFTSDGKFLIKQSYNKECKVYINNK